MTKDNKLKTQKLTIYLAKKKDAKDSSLIEVSKSEPAKELKIENAVCRLYIKTQKESSPPWSSLLIESGQVTKEELGFSKGTGAALIITVPEATFIITFGQGFHLLNAEAIERDFGLRVALNSIAPSDIHSLDKATDEKTPLNSRTQSGIGVDIFDLLIDPERDLLYAITGKSAVKEFGKAVTGRDSLQISVPVDLQGIPDLLRKALVQYNQKLSSDFKWVDNIRRIKDPELNEDLDIELVKRIKANNLSKIWLAEPEIVDYEKIDGYTFDSTIKSARYQFLSLDRLISWLANGSKAYTIDNIKNSSIYCRDLNHEIYTSWSAYRCLNAEVDLLGKLYILRNGIWYKLDANFVSTIDLEISKIPKTTFQLPDFNHANEGDYNEYVCKSDVSFSLMDKKMIPLGNGKSTVEFCDLIKDSTHLIHVKKYTGSSTLSHLFSQGLVAAEAFRKSEKFRDELNLKLPKKLKLADTTIEPNPANYEIVYAIYADKQLPDELPFFSKITLKNAYQNLRAMSYKVSIAKIDIHNNVKQLGKLKAQKKRANKKKAA
ncbi:TIGR04141 family sporadically distributed protein [Photobacterium indicum]|uniref:Sporadically distributed protein, TIGR04141 family n=1 Tax=Photobacterium indicum TaxID=81447 RepID=A0A2T3LEQ1_9GAMM|nr:TIGR04141 family sporadically distributed protein [Photobacterium indicum]PSV49863.1 sporadically distributed protein, TIGR04141 family [Photobacterium indicum]